MFTVALIGPDGAGKSTIGRSVEQRLPLPARYMYMGVNLEASDVMLPTTRLLRDFARSLEERPGMAGPPDPNRSNSKPKGLAKRVVTSFRSALRTLNLMAEEWFRQVVAWNYLRRGYVVLFDRHFFSDYYAHDVAANGAGRPFLRRLHGLMLERVYPRPDLFLFLDAPPEILLARKGEGTLELLERRRQEYLALQNEIEHFVTVDATQTPDMVTQEVSEAICSFYETYYSGKTKQQPATSSRQSVT
jgi:thymidylate kinase